MSDDQTPPMTAEEKQAQDEAVLHYLEHFVARTTRAEWAGLGLSIADCLSGAFSLYTTVLANALIDTMTRCPEDKRESTLAHLRSAGAANSAFLAELLAAPTPAEIVARMSLRADSMDDGKGGGFQRTDVVRG